MDLKQQLTQLKNKDMDGLREVDLESLIEEMLVEIGVVDPELRDKLIYPTFIKIISEGLLTGKQYQYILDTCLDEGHLFYRIGEKNTDSVFTRSFSSLVITGLLIVDREEGMLSEKNLEDAFLRGVKYLNQELDTRGFVEGKGWAHSIAHGADLLVSLVKHPTFTGERTKVILNTIHNCLFKEATYIDDEDERLIFVVEAMLDKNLDEKVLEHWIIQIVGDLESIFKEEGFSDKYFRTKFNIAIFLKSLYFRFEFRNDNSNVRGLIRENLMEIHQKIYGL